MLNEVSVISLDRKFKKFERKIRETASKILKILNKTGVAVEIYLIDGRKMRFLNKKFRGKNKTTTILSFEEPRNFILPASKSRKIGEIYLNASSSPKVFASGQSYRMGRHQASNKQLLTHGLLHLIGYNHQKKSDRIKMELKEQKILKFLISNKSNF